MSVVIGHLPFVISSPGGSGTVRAPAVRLRETGETFEISNLKFEISNEKRRLLSESQHRVVDFWQRLKQFYVIGRMVVNRKGAL